MNKHYRLFRALLYAHRMTGGLSNDMIRSDPWWSQFVLSRRRVISQHPRSNREFTIHRLRDATVDVFPVVSVLFNPKYPDRAGIPLRLWGLTSTFRTLTNAVWVLPKQAHKSLYSKHRSLALLFRASDLLPSFWNNTNHLLRSLIINIYRFPSIRRTIYITSLYLINTIDLLHSRTRDRLNTFPCQSGCWRRQTCVVLVCR